MVRRNRDRLLNEVKGVNCVVYGSMRRRVRGRFASGASPEVDVFHPKPLGFAARAAHSAGMSAVNSNQCARWEDDEAKLGNQDCAPGPGDLAPGEVCAD